MTFCKSSGNILLRLSSSQHDAHTKKSDSNVSSSWVICGRIKYLSNLEWTEIANAKNSLTRSSFDIKMCSKNLELFKTVLIETWDTFSFSIQMIQMQLRHPRRAKFEVLAILVTKCSTFDMKCIISFQWRKMPQITCILCWALWMTPTFSSFPSTSCKNRQLKFSLKKKFMWHMRLTSK